ncbi:SDR family NAD(P)-dependent oxidoreductase, partial [Rhizobium johnstonii]|uniref:SDR family NAD(P)-dependent oxidoreductase n=1 Tax=Rhizobium johnstonii TaxID=3019933 RepID=UPI003F958A32
PHGSGYASSKAAIMRLTECLNDTTISHGIRAFAVDPGLVRTDMTENQLFSEAGKTYLPSIQQLFDDAAQEATSKHIEPASGDVRDKK